MRVNARKIYAIVVMIGFLQAPMAQAIPFASLLGFCKVAVLSLAKKSGGKFMVRVARVVNSGTSMALGENYDQARMREFADTINDARAELLCQVIKNADEDGVEFLLRPEEVLGCYRGTEEDPTLLHLALRMKQYRAARLLLEIGVDPNKLGKAPFNDKLRPPIVEFARDSEAVLLLLEYGANPEWANEDGSIYSELFRHQEWGTICILHDRNFPLHSNDFLIALEHKEQLIEYELNAFLHQLRIKNKRRANSESDNAAPAAASQGLKEVMEALQDMPRREKLELLRILSRNRETRATGEKE